MGIIRMKSYKAFFLDGRSSATIDTADKSKVLVAIVLGVEPLKIKKDSQCLDTDEIILALAREIQRKRNSKRTDGFADTCVI